MGDGVPLRRGQAKLVEKPAGYTAGDPVVVYAEVCNHKVPRVMSPMMQATRLRIVLTWNRAPLVVDLHVACERTCESHSPPFGQSKSYLLNVTSTLGHRSLARLLKLAVTVLMIYHPSVYGRRDEYLGFLLIGLVVS